MRLIDELRGEHRVIDAALGALRTYVSELRAGKASPSDGARFARFFLEGSSHHHETEEGVLFAALVERLEVPQGNGPIAMLTQQHRSLAATLHELTAALECPYTERLDELAVAYSRALWVHADVEDSVLFPEAQARLLAQGARELNASPAPSEQAAVWRDAQALIARYPPTHDATVVRGEGCVICPNFGRPCEGIEREWWSDVEWDEFPHRVG